MTKHLDNHPRSAARGRSRRRPKKAEWSPERRARQAELIRALKPWEKSTGPRTAAGKARVAANALKHGFRSRSFLERIREERQLIHDAARAIALAKALFRALDGGAITVWTADPSDAPHLILSSLGRGASDRTKHSAVRSGQGSGPAT